MSAICARRGASSQHSANTGEQRARALWPLLPEDDMDETAQSSTYGLLVDDAEHDFPVLDSHAVVKDRVRGFRVGRAPLC